MATKENTPVVRRFPRVVVELGWVSLFTDAAGDMVYPLLPAFLLTLGGGAMSLGLVEGVSELVSAVVKWFSGRYADRGARKPLVLFGYAVATVVRPLLALAGAPWHVVAIRATDRFGKGVRSAPRDALLAEAVSGDGRAAAFGFHRAMDNAGAALGPLLAFLMMSGLGWTERRVFAMAAVPGVLALVLLARMKEPKRPVSAEAGAAKKGSAPLPRAARGYLFALAIFSLGASADSFLLLRLRELGMSAALLPIAWLTLNAAKALTNVPGGRLSDRIGHRKTVTAAWLVYAAVYFSFPYFTSWWSAWLIFVAYAAYYGLSEGGEKAILAELVPAESRGRAFGVMHAVTGVMVLPANLLFGMLYNVAPWMAFVAGGACALLGTVALVVLAPRKPA